MKQLRDENSQEVFAGPGGPGARFNSRMPECAERLAGLFAGRQLHEVALGGAA